MTDPRIEAALDAAWANTVQFQSGETFAQYNEREPYAAGEFRVSIIAAIAAADAAAWRPIADQPPSEPVLIMSEHGAAVAQWDMKIDAWRNEDTMFSPRYFTHWQPLPAPPANSAELGGVDG
ncbi:DUF551 domain-containing protein [Acetobacter sp.]|uniref:DUF551 domain-containing protein n=1 Tax=Acetobacter sp. TaxID=440 RepID=UPI00258C19CF|nr:DUF551 domain-containing protein [Acetobacter sp.]MCC6105939.1 DUF551 domain-containing protein [Acetobacter sp.]